MTRSVARARAAASIAADRSDVWTAAALAELLTVGWLPIVLAVVPLPSPSDIAFASAGLVGRPNAVVLGLAAAVAAVAAVLLTRLVVAVADGVVIGALASRPGPMGDASRINPRAAWGVQAVALVPLLLALVLVGYPVAAAAAAEWQAPDTAGVGFVGRLLVAVAPALVVVLLAALAAHAIGAAGMHRVVEGRASLRVAIRGAATDLRRRAPGVMAITLGGTLARVVLLANSFALLETMWRPIEGELAAGLLIALPTLPLLLGFVFVWLCLVIASGALRTALTIWWGAELSGTVPTRDTPEERGPTWTQRPSSS